MKKVAVEIYTYRKQNAVNPLAALVQHVGYQSLDIWETGRVKYRHVTLTTVKPEL